MEDFLAGTIFRYAIFPTVSVLLGIAIKYATRNDRYASFRKEDLAVGLDLMLTACLLFIVLTSDWAIALTSASSDLDGVLKATPIDTIKATVLQHHVSTLTAKLALSGWVITLMLLGLWSVSTIVRKWGWKSDTEMTPFIGIGLPLGTGVLFLVMVMTGASK